MRKFLVPWERPSGVSRTELVDRFYESMTHAVDEVCRAKRLLNNAQEAVVIAAKAGYLTDALLQERGRREIELQVLVGLLVDARGRVLDAEQQAVAQ